MDILKITNEEKESLETYKGVGYQRINTLLNDYIENDIFRFYDESNTEEIEKDVRKEFDLTVKDIKNIYSLMVKYSKKHSDKPNILQRGTGVKEINSYEKNPMISKLLSTTTDRNTSHTFSYNSESPAIADFKLDENIPFVRVGDILKEGSDGEKEYLIAPFINVESISEKRSIIEKDMYNKEIEIKRYDIEIKQRELNDKTYNNKNNIKESINQGIHEYAISLGTIVKNRKEKSGLESDIQRCSSNISRIENQGRKLSKEDIDDIKYYRRIIEESEIKVNELNKIEKELSEKVSNWKRNVSDYIQIECIDIKKEIEKSIENEKNKEKEAEKISAINKVYFSLDIIDKKILKTRKKIENYDIQDSRISIIAENIGITDYKRTNYNDSLNSFRTLESKINELSDIKGLKSISEIKEYYSNLKNLTSSFDNLDNIVNNIKDNPNENFKKLIYVKLEEMKAKANINILDKKEKIIDGKQNNIFKRISNLITGKSKIYNLQKQSISFLKSEVDKKKNSLKNIKSEDFSIHSILADMEIFINDNISNKEELSDIINYKEVLYSNLEKIYKIDKDKINKIVEKRTVDNLPTKKEKKLSPKDQIKEYEHIFLEKNVYNKVKTSDLPCKKWDQDSLNNYASEVSKRINNIINNKKDNNKDITINNDRNR